MPATEGALAVALLAGAREAGPAGLVHVAASEGRAERLTRLLWALGGDVETLPFPPWDCLPFDKVSPSAGVLGLRVAALARLAAGPDRPWILVATAPALRQRVPPRGIWGSATRVVTVGDGFDPEALAADLEASGHWAGERVDEPGEYAARGAVFDVFPAGYALPVRIGHEGGRVASLASFDATSQLTSDSFESLTLRPISEAVLSGDADGPSIEREPGVEHRLPEIYGALDTLYGLAPDAAWSLEPGVRDRAAAFYESANEAYESRLRFDSAGHRPTAPERLYLPDEEAEAALADRRVTEFAEPDEGGEEAAAPSFALAARPNEALAAFVAARREAGDRVIVAGPVPRDVAAVARRLERAVGEAPRPVATWDEAMAAGPGALLTLALPVSTGFAVPGAAVVAAADVLGAAAASASLAQAAAAGRTGVAAFDDGEDAYRIGDAVIHLEHGVGRLEGLETVTVGADGPADVVRLAYAGDATLMLPVDEIGLMWRYGPGDGAKLDKLGSESWPARRATVEAEIGEAATALAAIAAERRAADAPALVPPRRSFERFVAGFPFAETADQLAAVSDILRDLRSGRPMDRLVCGDVGFGKTEVALRAAAAAALAGVQVAIAAPTTVLVRQHAQTFARRFAAVGLEVATLSRLQSAADAKAVKAGLADGSVRVVVGTHALAAKGVAFAELGLLIVDEEQRFGAADKEKLRRLGRAVHVLTMTATPIPRTLQSALAGLQDTSVLATPPAERSPVRTVVAPLDEASFREALKSERRRGGQSFVVCPQIDDIEPMRERLRRIAPELSVLVAHGKRPAAEIDDVMVRFADGDGDVLLATNIIESGLDVPRANTIAIWRADRFGLSQLHQLRGRVGRGRARGVAYLLTEPDAEITDATARRLETLATLDRLGAGFAIGAEDLEQRGAGDLIGDTQAGHVKLIGSGLYRRLLERALVVARGGEPPDEWNPELNVGLSGRIPAEYVPEPEVRVNLYAALGRSRDEATETRMRDEIADRFGPPPAPVDDLLALARLRRLCREAGVARVDAGPQAVALTFKERGPGDPGLERLLAERPGLEWRGPRLVAAVALEDAARRLRAVEDLLDAARDA